MHRAPLRLGASRSGLHTTLHTASFDTASQMLISRKISTSASRTALSHAPSLHAPSTCRLLLISTRLPRQQPLSKSQIAILPSSRGRGYASSRNNKENEGPIVKDADGAGSGSRRRVEVNLAESVDQVALGYLKKYGRKVAIDWPIQGLKYGALGALALGGAGVVAASALAQKARSLFGGREVASYDPSAAAAKKKEGNFFSRMLQSHIQETLAHEVSRTMSLLAAINEASRLRHEMGGDVMIDMEKAMDRGEYLNPKIADQHPRFEMKTVRTWEYDEHWLVSATGRRARICVQGYLDEKDDLDREVEEKAERRQRAKERKKMGLKPEEEDNKQAEKTFNWHFVHISVFFDNDSRQLILTHDAEAGEDLIVLPDAEWPGQERSGRGAPHGASAADVDDAWSDEEDEDADVLRQRRPKAPQFIDAEVVQPKAANKNNKKR